MKWTEQLSLFDQTVAEEKRILDQKGHEYASDADALDNFKKRAADVGVDPKQILWIFLSKHLDSIKSFIRLGKTLSEEPIEGRINDARNYLFLLSCLVHEEKQAAHDAMIEELNRGQGAPRCSHKCYDGYLCGLPDNHEGEHVSSDALENYVQRNRT